MNNSITFIVSTLFSFQLYTPLFKVYNENNYTINVVIRKNISKPYADPLNEDKKALYQPILDEFNISVVEPEIWLKNGGITYCIDGDICNKKYLSYIESYIVNLISKLNPVERKRFTIISLIANTDYIWSYCYYMNLVDYVIFPHRDYLNSFMKLQIQHYNKYCEFPRDIKKQQPLYRNYIKSIGYDKKYPILDNINKLKSSKHFTTKKDLELYLNECINAKNLYIGNPKFDFKLSNDQIFEKYNIPKSDKIVLIFHPEGRMIRGGRKHGAYFKIFYQYMHDWFKELGYTIIVKDRNKNECDKRNVPVVDLDIVGDYHIRNDNIFPNPSLELLQIANISVIFSSSTIEEIIHTNTPFIDIIIDDVYRLDFFRNTPYCYVIDTVLPSKEEFIENVNRLTIPSNNIHNELINVYFPESLSPYSVSIYNTVNKLHNEKQN